MVTSGIIPVNFESVKWQDYRHSKNGMLVYYNTDPVSELPIREIPEQLPSEISPDPHYESKTYGFFGCKNAKLRNSFVKTKIGYLFFMTRYAGVNVDFADELMITGYYHIKQTTDVQKIHIRHLNEYSCIEEENCIALRADIAHFVSVEDAFLITPEILKSWDYGSRITRQTKIVLSEAKTIELLGHFLNKDNRVDDYKEETERLWPGLEGDDDDDDEDQEEGNEDVSDTDPDDDDHK